MLKTKFFSYISYLMVSIYLEATYANIIKEQELEYEKGEEHYKALFEYEETAY